jgi:hypothetical protein
MDPYVNGGYPTLGYPSFDDATRFGGKSWDAPRCARDGTGDGFYLTGYPDERYLVRFTHGPYGRPRPDNRF